MNVVGKVLHVGRRRSYDRNIVCVITDDVRGCGNFRYYTDGCTVRVKKEILYSLLEKYI